MIPSAPALEHPPRVQRGYLTVDRVLEFIAVFVLAAGLGGLGTALLGLFHAPQVVLLGALVVVAYARCTGGRRLEVSPAPSAIHLIVISLIALLFRVPAYFYVLGGQDEGVYVNMALNIARTGSIAPRDAEPSIIEDPSARARYVRDNYDGRAYLPGIYRLSDDPPRLQFQFYHLFPVWMAIFGGSFGAAGAVYALTFLALLSVIFLYRLTLALTQNRRAASAVGILIAVNPLHAFFSKFPLSEVAALAFSSIAFAFLATYWHQRTGNRNARLLVLSALALFCVFETRISGFLYMPFLCLLGGACLLRDPEQTRRTAIQSWILSVIALYAVSVIQGLCFSSAYAHDVYNAAFGGVFGPRWKVFVLVAVLSASLAWLALWFVSRSDRRRAALSWIVDVSRHLLRAAVVAALLIGGYRAFQLGFTNRYASDPVLGTRFHLAGAGWYGFASSSLVVSAEYLCPLLLLGLLVAMVWRWREPALQAAWLFLWYFVIHISVLEWVVPYQPYFARYLVSEFVPYAILFVVCIESFLRPGALRFGLRAGLLISGLYALVLSGAQMGKKENEQAYESIGRIAAGVGPRDLLLIDSSQLRGIAVSELKTPLIYTFGVHVADISSESIANVQYLRALRSTYDNLFLVSGRTAISERFEPLQTFRVRASAFLHGVEPPTRTFWRIDIPLHLFKLRAFALPLDEEIHFGTAGSQWNDCLEAGWSVPEPWGVWALGRAAGLRLNYEVAQPVRALRLGLKGFVNALHAEQRIWIKIDGVTRKELLFHHPGSVDLITEVPVGRREARSPPRLRVEFVMPDAVSPASLGMSRDSREIGIGLVSLQLVTDRDARGLAGQVDTPRQSP